MDSPANNLTKWWSAGAEPDDLKQFVFDGACWIALVPKGTDPGPILSKTNYRIVKSHTLGGDMVLVGYQE